MTAETQELVAVAERLPPDKRVAVAEFARFLLARESKSDDADAAWERALDAPQPRPKLAAFLGHSRAEGSEQLNFYRLE